MTEQDDQARHNRLLRAVADAILILEGIDWVAAGTRGPSRASGYCGGPSKPNRSPSCFWRISGERESRARR